MAKNGVGVHDASIDVVLPAKPTGPAPPPPPQSAAADEKDLYWFTHVYQGDHTPQLTFRAVAMGAILGMLMSVSNLYTTLKVGWSFGVAITSCVLSYVIWNGLRGLSGGRLTRMSILESNCMQSTASAAGYSTGATIATCFGALLLVDPAHRHYPWYIVGAFTLLTGVMGVFLAIPMKRQMINHEQLPFPSGIAAATTLKSLYSEGLEAMRKAYALVVALVCGVAVGILNTGEGTLDALDRFFLWMRTHLFNVQLPEQVPANGFAFAGGKPMVGGGLESSVLLIAAGMIVGVRVSLSMLASSALLYFVVTPWLVGIDAAHANDPSWVTSIPLVGNGALLHPPRWGLWGGTAVMVFASLTALALQWRTVARAFTMFRGPESGSASSASLQARMAAIEVPTSWLVVGVLPLALAMVALQVLAFSIHWWAGLIAVAMSFVLSLVASRATGETDTTPVGAMGKVMQLLFAVFMPAQMVPNLAAAGIAANSASSSADLLTDLKSGYLLGANPRRQFIAQVFGVLFGTLAIVPAWYLMIPTAEVLDKYPLPATRMWEAVARLLAQGLDTLPVSARWAALIGALIGIALPLLEHVAPSSRRWLPSAMGVGLGWVVFFTNALSFTIGALIAWTWYRIDARSQDTFNVPIASGLVAGESMIKAFIAMAATALGLFGLSG